MFRYFVLIVLLFIFTLGCNIWSKPASGWTGAAGGEQIEKLFWQNVQAKNWAEVDKHVAATFAGAGAAGTAVRDAFLRDLQKTPLTDFSLSECASQTNGADLMVTCILRANWAGEPVNVATLSVWQQLRKGWVMVAHSESKLRG